MDAADLSRELKHPKSVLVNRRNTRFGCHPDPTWPLPHKQKDEQEAISFQRRLQKASQHAVSVGNVLRREGHLSPLRGGNDCVSFAALLSSPTFLAVRINIIVGRICGFHVATDLHYPAEAGKGFQSAVQLLLQSVGGRRVLVAFGRFGSRHFTADSFELVEFHQSVRRCLIG